MSPEQKPQADFEQRLLSFTPFLQAIRAVDTHLGIRSHLDCSSTDANIPLSLGIPALAIGA